MLDSFICQTQGKNHVEVSTTNSSVEHTKSPLPAYISPHSAVNVKSKKILCSANVMNIPVILTASFGRLLGPVGTFSILRSVSMPSMTLPKTTCFPSRKSHGAVVMKNCKPRSGRCNGKVGLETHLAAVRVGAGVGLLRVSDPTRKEHATVHTIERSPGPVCFTWKFSS